MDEFKGTKGLWHVECCAVLDENDNELAEAALGKDDHGFLLPVDMRIANGKIMAASKDLLEALQLVLAGLQNGNVKSKPIITFDPTAKSLPMQSLEEIISSAIAKAVK